MNELVARKNNLPAMPIGEVKTYVDVIGDAIDALKAKRSAAAHFNIDNETVAEMDRQIVEYSALKVQAQMELGKRTAAMEKTKGGDPTLFQGADERGVKTKADQLAAINLKPQRASEFERMAEHEDIVSQYIIDALANGKAPTKGGALNEIERRTKPRGFTAEDRASRRETDAIVAEMYDTENVPEYTVEMLIGIIKANAEEYVGVFRRLLSDHRDLLTDANRPTVEEAIDTYLIKEILKVKEGLTK